MSERMNTDLTHRLPCPATPSAFGTNMKRIIVLGSFEPVANEGKCGSDSSSLASWISNRVRDDSPNYGRWYLASLQAMLEPFFMVGELSNMGTKRMNVGRGAVDKCGGNRKRSGMGAEWELESSVTLSQSMSKNLERIWKIGLG